MRWEDERYVRVYTRDTPEWCLLSWEARALFLFLLRAVDRAGILPVGKSGARSVAALVRMPLEATERAIAELLEDGCVRMSPDGAAVVIPNFVAAQEAKQSDKARQKAARERARARAAGEEEAPETSHGVTDESRGVTEPSRAVTGSHAPSHGVTLSRAVPSHAQPKDPPLVPPPGGTSEAGAMLLDVGEPAKAKKNRRKPAEAADMSHRPEAWAPNEGHFTLGGELGLSRAEVTAEVGAWTDYHIEKETPIKDFDGSFRTWIRNEAKFRRRRAEASSGAVQRPAKPGEFTWKRAPGA